MKNFVKLFTENGLSSVKNAIQSANNMLQSFSLSDIGKACDEAQERFSNEYHRFKSQLLNFIDKHTVEIPFNKENEHLSYELQGDVFQVSVNSKDGEHVSNHVFTLPENVDISEMYQTYDSERKIMVFKFGKKID